MDSSDKDPSHSLDSVEHSMSDIGIQDFGPPASVRYFKEEMLPKYIATLLRRG